MRYDSTHGTQLFRRKVEHLSKELKDFAEAADSEMLQHCFGKKDGHVNVCLDLNMGCQQISMVLKVQNIKFADLTIAMNRGTVLCPLF